MKKKSIDNLSIINQITIIVVLLIAIVSINILIDINNNNGKVIENNITQKTINEDKELNVMVRELRVSDISSQIILEDQELSE